MSRRIALLALVLAVLVSAVPLSSAAFTDSTSSTATVQSSIDWTSPTVTMQDPGALLSGTVTLAASATDAETAVATVTIQVAPTGTGQWSTVCVRTTAPYTCSLPTTTLADGRYDFRATAVDTEGNSASSSIVGPRTVDNLAPTVSVVEPSTVLRGTVELLATAQDAGSGVVSVRLQRSLANANTWTDVCATTTAPYRCSWDTTTVVSDYYDLRAIAFDGAGNGTTSVVVADALVDNVKPSISLNSVPTLRGTVTLSATATDELSGIATVGFEYQLSGTTTWTTACTSTRTGNPYTCSWNTTTVANDTYHLRAVATDGAGNTATSNEARNQKVDNTIAAVSVADPGAFLRGTVAVTADASTPTGVTVTSVRIQRAVSGSTTWTDLCTDTTAPYSCDWSTTLVADGLYDLRAIMLDSTNKVTTSAVVAQRRVDNTPVRGVDVQTTNGGTLGRIDAGDTISFTWSEQMALGSILPGWAGDSQAVVIRVRDGALVGGGGTDDTLDVFTSSNLATPVRVGAVNLRGGFVKNNKTAQFNATMTQSSASGVTVVTMTVGTPLSGNGLLSTSTSTTPMVWTPSSASTDRSGNPCSMSPVTESGAPDRDF